MWEYTESDCSIPSCFNFGPLRQFSEPRRMEGDPNLRSRESIQNAFVLFMNKTQRVVDVYWVDYEGKFVPYMRLDPGGRTIINTFSTHPWVFKDSYTGERMHVENSDVFWPKPFFVVNLQPNNEPTIRRKQVDIHFPLRNLQQNAMWAIVRQLQRIESIDALEIPSMLKVELKTIFKEYDKHRERYINR